jgi:hypothetical protein
MYLEILIQGQSFESTGYRRSVDRVKPKPALFIERLERLQDEISREGLERSIFSSSSVGGLKGRSRNQEPHLVPSKGGRSSELLIQLGQSLTRECIRK